MPTNKPKLGDDQKERARFLRRAAPFPERLIWERLRAKRSGGFKFRRQHAIGPYYLDFFCHEALLAVEIDGRSHEGQSDSDTQRTSYLRKHGLTVIRFKNDEVLQNPDAAAQQIIEACEQAVSTGHSPSPNPSQREGSPA